MAARRIEAGTLPAAVPGLTVGVFYTMQHVSPRGRLFVRTAATPPTDPTEPAFILRPIEHGTVKLNTGQSLYAWGDRVLFFVIDEAP